MSPERDEPDDDEQEREPEPYQDIAPRSIFAATWFRVVLVVIVLGVIGAVAVPYVLDWMSPPPPLHTAATRPPLSPPSFGEKPAGETAPADRPITEQKDSTLVPAPTAQPAPTAPAPTAVTPPAESKPAPPQPEVKSTPRPAPTPPAVAKSEPKAAATTKPRATKPSAVRPAAAGATKPAPAARGPFWVQVGAFKDPEAARRLAIKLRDQNFKVEESVRRTDGTAAAAKAPASAPSGTDQYDVFVSGMSPAELNKRLAGKGLAAEPSGDGVVVRPSLPLRDAVTLSKDLAVEGFKVQVRRTGGGPPMATTPSAPAEGVVLHRVRVGAFDDRAAAQATVRELQAKGYKPFIARGDQ